MQVLDAQQTKDISGGVAPGGCIVLSPQFPFPDPVPSPFPPTIPIEVYY